MMLSFLLGILAQEVTGNREMFGYGQYIASSYVKLIEEAGARVAPILYPISLYFMVIIHLY